MVGITNFVDIVPVRLVWIGGMGEAKRPNLDWPPLVSPDLQSTDLDPVPFDPNVDCPPICHCSLTPRCLNANMTSSKSVDYPWPPLGRSAPEEVTDRVELAVPLIRSPR